MARWHFLGSKHKKIYRTSKKLPIIILSSKLPDVFVGQNLAFPTPHRDEIRINLKELWINSGRNQTRFKHNFERVIGHEISHYESAIYHDIAKRKYKKTTFEGQEKMAKKFSPLIIMR
jgi:hypothetical protein